MLETIVNVISAFDPSIICAISAGPKFIFFEVQKSEQRCYAERFRQRKKRSSSHSNKFIGAR